MSNNTSLCCIADNNLSSAWVRAVALAASPGVEALTGLNVSVKITPNVDAEDLAIRKKVDDFLRQYGKRSCAQTANTIFPNSFSHYKSDRTEFYKRYEKVLPRLKKSDRANQYGMYFERMIAYGVVPNTVNQLEHIISTYQGGNHRMSALQLSIFDPHRDHTNQPLRGFPCLQQVNFVPGMKGELGIVGVYANQYLVDRAYGNYLGLYRLGQFVAQEIGMTLTQLTCLTVKAQLGTCSKRDANALVSSLSEHMTTAEESLSG